MFAAKVSFDASGDKEGRIRDAAESLLATWYKNGQILGSSRVLADLGTSLDAYVTVPQADALETRHNNVYAMQELEALRTAAALVTILGPSPSETLCCSCPSRSALLLYTHYLCELPPVRCLDCLGPVPLYRLPHVHDHEHLVLLQWAADYRACDTLQMHCSTGERFGEAQLFRHDSALSRNGRELASKLEAASGMPVYYYLHKTRGRGHGAEMRRLCPSCGSAWRLERPLHHFDFRCDRCRLLSAVAADTR
jgi:predicted  nucleic acid-binding Zn ribbon protein